jgi:hypothetical protein
MRKTPGASQTNSGMSEEFKVGNHVRWIGGYAPGKSTVGTIIDVKPAQLGRPGFAVYEVMFEFEVWYVFGDQLELVD